MKTIGKVLTVLGSVIFIASLVIGGILTVSGFANMFDTSNQQPLNGPGNSITQYFDAGQEMQLYTYGANGTYVGPVPICSSSGPAPVQQGSAVRSSITIGAESRISFSTLVFPVSGEYKITCNQPGVTIGPPLVSSGMVAGIGGIFLFVGGTATGLILVGVGIALWIFGARQESKPPVQHPNYPPPGTTP